MPTDPLELETFSSRVEFLEGELENVAVTLKNPTKKKNKKKSLCDAIVYCIEHFHTSTKALLAILLVSICIFVLIKATPVAGWIVEFFEDVYTFVADAIDWVVELIEEIYSWIVDEMDTLIDGVSRTVQFVKDFPETMKQFFSDLLDKFQSIFRFVEDFPSTMKKFFVDFACDLLNHIPMASCD
jgi:phage-related protein